jgi:hypothetical protein
MCDPHPPFVTNKMQLERESGWVRGRAWAWARVAEAKPVINRTCCCKTLPLGKKSLSSEIHALFVLSDYRCCNMCERCWIVYICVSFGTTFQISYRQNVDKITENADFI